MLEQLLVLRLLGGDALSDTEILKDEALSNLFSWKGLLHPTNMARRLKSMTYGHNLALQDIVRQLGQAVAGNQTAHLIAVDSTVIEAYGRQEGADMGYNPKKPGRPSYHAMVAVGVEVRSVLDGYLRPGSASSNNGLDGFLKKIVAETDQDPSHLVFRLDKGMTAEHTLDTLEELGCGYVAKIKKTGPLMGRITKVKSWRSIGNGIFVTSFRYQPDSWNTKRRFVVIERHVEPKPSDQLDLFDLQDGRYEIIVTNLSHHPENIWRLYNRGAIVEQVIEEIKNDLAAGTIKTNHFWANDALFLTGLIAYNLTNYLRRIALPRGFHTARLKRLGFCFLYLGARLARHAGRFWIKINRDYPMRFIFYRAMDIMAPD